jgi:hypothetical protein
MQCVEPIAAEFEPQFIVNVASVDGVLIEPRRHRDVVQYGTTDRNVRYLAKFTGAVPEFCYAGFASPARIHVRHQTRTIQDDGGEVQESDSEDDLESEPESADPDPTFTLMMGVNDGSEPLTQVRVSFDTCVFTFARVYAAAVSKTTAAAFPAWLAAMNLPDLLPGGDWQNVVVAYVSCTITWGSLANQATVCVPLLDEPGAWAWLSARAPL